MTPKLQPLKIESLKDQFVKRFEELILSGELSIGQKLPSERELALQMQVSRPVVHEGLVELAARGLVTMKPRFGSVVSDYREEGSLALLTSLFSYHKSKMEPHLLNDALAMRMLTEVEIAKLAARNRTETQLKQLIKISELETQSNFNDVDAIAEMDFRFHLQLAICSDNFMYPLFINSLKQVYTAFTTQFFLEPEVIPIVIEHHKKIIIAIQEQNEMEAAELMRTLLEHGREHLMNQSTN